MGLEDLISFYMIPPNINFGGISKSLKDSKIVLLGFPLDITTSYRPGTRFAPQRIREVSNFIECFSLKYNKDFEDIGVFDSGDLQVLPSKILKNIERCKKIVCEVLKKNKIPLIIGGEHTITLAPISCLKDLLKDLGIVIFDAHLDLRDEYPLGDKFTHATVSRRLLELSDKIDVLYIGTRAISKEEISYIRRCKRAKIMLNNKILGDFLMSHKNIYLSVDFDVFDPSIAPGVGNPEPGGIYYKEFTNLLYKIIDSRKIIGIDIVEVSPPFDLNNLTSILAAKIIYEMIIGLNSFNSSSNS